MGNMFEPVTKCHGLALASVGAFFVVEDNSGRNPTKRREYSIKINSMGGITLEDNKNDYYVNVFNIELNQYDFHIKLGRKKLRDTDHQEEDFDLTLTTSPLFIKEFATKMLLAVEFYEKSYMPIQFKEIVQVESKGQENERP